MQWLTKVVQEKPGRDEAGLVVFGRNAAVELPPTMSFPLDRLEVTLQLDRDGTNLQRALTLASAMLPDENQGRLVLISDGAATEGSLNNILSELKSRGVAVDVLPIAYEHKDEVVVERLELPRAVKKG